MSLGWWEDSSADEMLLLLFWTQGVSMFSKSCSGRLLYRFATSLSKYQEEVDELNIWHSRCVNHRRERTYNFNSLEFPSSHHVVDFRRTQTCLNQPFGRINDSCILYLAASHHSGISNLRGLGFAWLDLRHQKGESMVLSIIRGPGACAATR